MTSNYRRWVYALVVLLVVISGLYLSGLLYGVLRACGNILALYFLAWLLQFFFSPVVDFLTGHHLPRLAAVAYVYVVLMLVVVIAAIAIIPPIYSQSQTLAKALSNTSTYNIISNSTKGFESFLVDRLHVPPHDIKQFTENYGVSLRKGAVQTGAKVQQAIRDFLTPANLGNSATTVVSIFSTISSALINFVIVLLLAFYMTLDGRTLARRALGYFPAQISELGRAIYAIVNRKFGGYLRGQIILSLSYGVLTYIIAAAFALQYSIFIAIFAAAMMLIPFIGAFAAIVPPIIFFFVSNPTFQAPKFILLLVFLVGSQQLVLNLLAPRVMGNAVGMHPLLVVLGLLLGIKVAGLWGAVFGVPVFAVITDAADLIYRRIMAARFHFEPREVDDLTESGLPTANEPLDTDLDPQPRHISVDPVISAASKTKAR